MKSRKVKKNKKLTTMIIVVLSITVMAFIISCSKRNIRGEIKVMNTKEFIRIMESGEIDNYTLVDVRTEEEYNEVSIPGSILKPVQQISGVEDLEEFDKSKPVIVHCRSGARSMIAASIFRRAGFEVHNLDEGILGVIDANFEGLKKN